MSKRNDKHDNTGQDAIFRDALSDVKPLQARKRHRNVAAPPAKARFRRQDERSVLDESLHDSAAGGGVEIGEELLFQRPQISRHIMRQLRRGRYSIQEEIDLHGLTVAEAKDALKNFIAECAASRITCVRIIHGKGLRSGPGGPVLKHQVNRWLRQWQPVKAFVTAQPQHGGTGALYVLLGD
jgi:DNA-nicking Smr family endonuclease